MGHLWFIIQIVCTHSPLKDCWHFTMQYLQDLLVLEMFKHPDMGEFMIYRVIFILLYEYHWKVHTMAILPHIEDCSALWIGNPAPLIDIDVHLHCEAFYKIELDASILTFSGHILWFLIITLLMNKCMLFHPPDDRMGMDTAFFGLVQPTVKSNEFCLYVLQLLALGIPSIQEINSVPFCPAILAMHITPCHLYFDSRLPYSTVPQHTLLTIFSIALGDTLEYCLSGLIVLLNQLNNHISGLQVLLNQLNNQIHALTSFGNQQSCASYFPSVCKRTSTRGLHANTQISQISLFQIDSSVFPLDAKFLSLP